MGEYAELIGPATVLPMGCVVVLAWMLVRLQASMGRLLSCIEDLLAMQKDPGYGRIKAMQQRKEVKAGSENRKTMGDLLNKVWGKKEQHKREQNRAGRDTRTLRERLRAGATVTSMAPADMPPPTTEEPPSPEGGS